MTDPYGKLEGDRYVLRRVDTPRAWYHTLSNGNYLLQISQLGSGFSVYRSISGNQVTRKSWPDDDAGRFLYVRDRETGSFWSPTVWPVETDTSAFDDWSCTFSPGAIAWKACRDGLDAQLRTAVSLDDPVEMHHLTMVNRGNRHRRLDLFFFLEWVFEGAPGELGRNLSCDFDREHACLVADLEVPPQYRYCQTGFLSASADLIGYAANRRDFLGQPGSLSAPMSVRQGSCCGLPGKRLVENACGALQVRMELAPSAAATVVFITGVGEDRQAVGALRRKYADLSQVATQFTRIDDWWKRFTSRQKIGLPKACHELEDWTNSWLKVQVEQNFRYTRWAAARGYRDVLQDSAGVRLLDPRRARDKILEALAHQRADGHAPRQYPVAPWEGYDWRDYRDSPVWIVYALEKYLKETGDTAVLQMPVPFFDKKAPDTVFEHARVAMDFLWKERGSHGLCLLGHGDWLDSLNNAGVKGKGESVWLSMALCYALREMAVLAELAGETATVKTFQERYHELRTIINREAWDGRWYLTAFGDDGARIGSAASPDGGKIFLNPQSWAILAGIASPERAATVMHACDDKLKDEAGYLCFTPLYRQYDPSVGRISLWPSEGGSVYSHAVFFKIAADCLLGEGDRAWQTLREVVPAGGIISPGQSGAEPFTVPNAYMGPEWPRPFWTYQGWWTASADWALQLIVETMCGARAEYGGLRLDPCLPSAWTEARIHRAFRGSTYDIKITKPTGICRGKVSLTLDGQLLPDSLIPPETTAGLHDVEARIEKS